MTVSAAMVQSSARLVARKASGELFPFPVLPPDLADCFLVTVINLPASRLSLYSSVDPRIRTRSATMMNAALLTVSA